jgi:2-polyprenyl-6-hydroxyphenyl methylase / 3-demethylubiquinone-9 3-methyltransferase
MTNVSAQEVAHFDNHDDDWWDLKGPYKTLHWIHLPQWAFIQSRLSLAGKNVLDLGCGGGLLSESLAQAGATVLAVDPASSAIACAKKHAEASDNPLFKDHLSYQQGSIDCLLDSHKNSFDIITCMELLEHVPSPALLLEQCKSLLKPGGNLILSTLNRTPKMFAQAIVGAEYLLGWIPKGTHHYLQCIRPSECQHWATEAGLRLQSLRGISYNILQQAFVLCKDTGVHYLMHLQK